MKEPTGWGKALILRYSHGLLVVAYFALEDVLVSS
jgi:hypothetical protein